MYGVRRMIWPLFLAIEALTFDFLDAMTAFLTLSIFEGSGKNSPRTCGWRGLIRAAISSLYPDSTPLWELRKMAGASSAPIRSSPPPAEQEIEFFFELVPEGALTPLLYKLQSGDELLMRKVPKGRFLLETHTGRSNHLLVSTVTGVAPFVSYVRTLHKAWKEGNFDGSHKLYLLNGASRPWEFGYRHELLRFAQEIPWFTYVPTLSRPWDHGDWTGEMGRADDVLRKYADQWGLDAGNTIAYLCGHPEMIAHSKAILKRRGFLDEEAIKEEIYRVPAK